MLKKKTAELSAYLKEILKDDVVALDKIEEFRQCALQEYAHTQINTQKLESILDNVFEGIVSINASGTVASFNKSAEEIFGYDASDVIGKNVKMLMPEPYHSEHDGYLHNYKTTHVKKIIGIGREVLGQRKDKTTFPLYLAVTEIQYDDEPLFIGLVRDLSEQKHLEKMKNEFISTVSHELRTPLTSIQGSLSLINSGVMGEVNEKIKPLLSIALNNSERLISLINDILDIEKIESGKMEFDFQEYNLVTLIEEALQMNAGYAKKYGVNMEFITNEKKVLAHVDKNRFQQVMSNLLSNAIKYSPKSEAVKIKLSLEKQSVKVEVIDKGEGIDKEFQKRIFQKFAQADASNTKQKGGTGLGLNITKAIVEQMGGTIGFEPEQDKGTRFYFTLPIAEKNNAVSLADETKEFYAKVLIVEDDHDIAKLISLMLQGENIRCDIAYDALNAKKLLLENKYDAMTLDIDLPDQDGYALLEELRTHAEYADLPVIIVSANVVKKEPKPENLALNFKVINSLIKPIDQKELISSLKNALHPNENKLPTLLHVEDDKDIASLSKILLEDIANVELATTKKEAMQMINTRHYDMLLLDIMLPDGSIEDILPEIKEKYPSLPVILFTAQEVNKTLKDKVSKALIKSRTSNVEFLDTIKNILAK
jgi:PAS domain S-box-containing protein